MPITTGGLPNYNQKFIDTADHIDQFIQNRNRKHPNIWFDRVPKGQLSMFEGLVRSTNIFHGGLGDQAGLNNWSRIQISRKPVEGDAGYDACAYDPKTLSYAWESRQYTGYKSSWQSEPICINDIVYVEQGRQQAAMITSFLAFITMSVWENWNREQYVYAAVQADNAFILTEGGLDYSDGSDVRFQYDPFETHDFGGDEEDSFIKFPASLNISTLNWSYFDWWQDYLGDQAPEAAVANVSGQPMFGLMLHKRDFDKFVMNDPDIREDIRYAKSEVLFDDYRKFDMFRGWGIVHDSRQMRFKVAKIVDESGVDMVYAKRVKPMKATRAGTIGNIPEADPEYHNAEIAIGVIFMNDVFQNMIPSTVANPGGGMVFGAVPNYNGTFAWINEYDRELNPLREVGYFFARFEAFPKPLMYFNEAIAFVYRRCPQTWGSDCDTACDGTPATTAQALTADAVAGDVDTLNNTITVTLVDCIEAEVGESVTVSTVTPAGYVVEDALAPTYVIGWEPGDYTINIADFVDDDPGPATTVIKA